MRVSRWGDRASERLNPPPPEKSQKSGFQQYWSGSMDPDKIFLKGVHVCVLVVHFKNIESFFLLKKCLRQSVFYQRRLNIMNIVTLFIVFYCKNTITQFWREQRPLFFFFFCRSDDLHVYWQLANTFQIHVVYRLSVICVIKQIHKL